jgi:hypothetical protein
MSLGAHIMLFVLEMAIKFSGLPTCLVNVTFIGRDDCLLARVAPLVGFVFLSSLQWNLSIRVLKFQKIKSPQV